MRDFKKIDLDILSVDHASDISGSPEHCKSSCHDFYEIFYVEAGVGRYFIEGRSFSIGDHTLILSRPLEYHGYSLESSSGYSRYVVKFSPLHISESNRQLLDRILDGVGGVLYSSLYCAGDIAAVFKKLLLMDAIADSERLAFTTALLTELLILLSSATCVKMVNTEDTLVPRVMRYINSGIQSDLHLDTIAGQFFVNKCYLCRAFKQYSGISIHTYINQKRVYYAKQLIESGEIASSAAERVGFGDYSSFYRAYMKYLGVPPTAHQPKRGGVL